jgi:hypothetical protein
MEYRELDVATLANIAATDPDAWRYVRDFYNRLVQDQDDDVDVLVPTMDLAIVGMIRGN